MLKSFDLAHSRNAADFQREMYNLASILKTVVNKLDVEKCQKLVALKREASDMKSFNTSGAWKTEKAKGGKGGRMNTIPEEGRGSEPQDEDGQCSEPQDEGEDGQRSEPRDEDSLGVFDDPVIHAVLNNMNYEISYIDYQVCVPSIT
jgi:hypothetical protein